MLLTIELGRTFRFEHWICGELGNAKSVTHICVQRAGKEGKFSAEGKVFPAMGVFCQGAIMGSRILPDPPRRNRQSIWKPQWNRGTLSPHIALQEIKSRKFSIYIKNVTFKERD